MTTAGIQRHLDYAENLRREHVTDWDAALHSLREAGANIVESAIVTARTLDVGLGIAKRIVHFSPAWDDERFAAEELHAIIDPGDTSVSSQPPKHTQH